MDGREVDVTSDGNVSREVDDETIGETSLALDGAEESCRRCCTDESWNTSGRIT
jgi:hypothetical protein